jgi:hypothetical protein
MWIAGATSWTPLLGRFTLATTCTNTLEHAAEAFGYWGSRGHGKFTLISARHIVRLDVTHLDPARASADLSGESLATTNPTRELPAKANVPAAAHPQPPKRRRSSREDGDETVLSPLA